jgi:flagellar biosynthesis protein FlhF
MLLESFQGSDPRHVLDDARRALGDDVLIVRSRVERRGSRTFAEVVAATPRDLEALSHRLTPAPPSLPRETGGRGRSGPFVIALVGPTGAGKSSTLVKLALNNRVFGNVRVGLVTLDTFRVAALEHLQQYADIGNLALEAIYDQREVPAALSRLDNCDVIIVDTPGRSPRATDANAHWQAMLAAISADETHLVLPSTIRPDAIPGVLAAFDATNPTHLVLTKVDELPDESMLTDVIAGTNLPLRWVTTGQAVPDDIRPARGRIFSALGLGRTPSGNTAVAA